MLAKGRFALKSVQAFSVLLILLACTPPETVVVPPESVSEAPTQSAQSQNQPTADASLALKPGQSATFNGSAKLHYIRVINDSRCPPDVQCVWAGEVTIELMLESGKENQTFTIKDNSKAVNVLDYSIALIWIDRKHLIQVKLKKR